METPEALATKLRNDGERLRTQLSGLREDQRDAKVYTEGGLWTVRSVLAHLMSAERSFLILFERIRRGGHGASADFKIDAFNAREQLRNEGMGWEELLKTFETTRARMVSFVESLNMEDLDRRERHPHLGPTSLREMIKMIYIHDQSHWRDIRRILGNTES